MNSLVERRDQLLLNCSGIGILWPNTNSLKRSLSTLEAVDPNCSSIDIKRAKRVEDCATAKMNLVLAPSIDTAAHCQHQ
jgi:hypothetical protein